MLIIFTLFALFSTERFILERDQFDDIHCGDDASCHVVKKLEWIACHGASNQSLICHKNTYGLIKMKNMTIEYDKLRERYTMNVSTSWVLGPVVYFESIINDAIGFIDFITMGKYDLRFYEFHFYQQEPNAVLRLKWPPLESRDIDYGFWFCLLLTMFVFIVHIFTAIQTRSPTPKKDDSLGFALPDNVKFISTKIKNKFRKQLIDDSKLLCEVIEYCQKGTAFLWLDCQQRSIYTIEIENTDGKISQKQLIQLRDRYPTIIQSTVISPSRKNSMILTINLSNNLTRFFTQKYTANK
jgi:hypothetical protein